MDRIEYRVLRPSEAQDLVGWAGDEGWNPGLNDALIFHSVDPDGWFGAFRDGIMVGGAVATNYDRRFSFGGFYIVSPAYRRSGIGWSLTGLAVEHAGDRCFGIDGVLGMEDRYHRRMRLHSSYRNVRWGGSSQNRKGPDGLRDWRELSWRELVDFDSRHFPARREGFLKDWLMQSGSKTLTALGSDGGIVAMGTIRPCLQGYKVGPLFAEGPRLARSLLDGLLEGVTGPYYLDVPEPNREGMALAVDMGMTPVFHTARMYSQEPPVLSLQDIYGVTSFELG